MSKLLQLLLFAPLAAAIPVLLLYAVYRFLRLSLPSAVQPSIKARTHVEIFLTTAAYIGLLFVAVLLALVIGALAAP